jgi:hypothetical protein
MVLLRWTGPFSGINRGPLFRCKRFGPSYPERRALRAIIRSAPARPEEHRETNRWHPQRKREIMGLMADDTSYAIASSLPKQWQADGIHGL